MLRDGEAVEVLAEEAVPGEIVLLSAGGTVPGDCLLLEAKDLAVDEAALIGESFPAAKSPGGLPADTPLAARANYLFMGTHVLSGTAKALVVRVGREMEFGKISGRLRLRPAETDFERGCGASAPSSWRSP